MNVFRVTIPVRFQYCDPAGIVFYPRYFEMINQVIEDWFANLGYDYRTIHIDQGVGIPMVRCECDFTRPSRLGDQLEFELRVERVGRSAFTVLIRATEGAEERLRARLVLAYATAGAKVSSLPLPEPLRAGMQRFLVSPTSD